MDATLALETLKVGVTVGSLRDLVTSASAGQSVIDPTLTKEGMKGLYLYMLAGYPDEAKVTASLAEGARRGGVGGQLEQTALSILRDCAPDDWAP